MMRIQILIGCRAMDDRKVTEVYSHHELGTTAWNAADRVGLTIDRAKRLAALNHPGFTRAVRWTIVEELECDGILQEPLTGPDR